MSSPEIGSVAALHHPTVSRGSTAYANPPYCALPLVRALGDSTWLRCHGAYPREKNNQFNFSRSGTPPCNLPGSPFVPPFLGLRIPSSSFILSSQHNLAVAVVVVPLLFFRLLAVFPLLFCSRASFSKLRRR